jgi:hypothetical protein
MKMRDTKSAMRAGVSRGTTNVPTTLAIVETTTNPPPKPAMKRRTIR